jgi:hypothetical protein
MVRAERRGSGSSGSHFRFACLASGAVAVLAASVVTWWVVGDQTSTGFNEDELDYSLRAPGWALDHAEPAGVIGSMSLIVAVAVLGWAAVTRRINSQWLIVVASLMAVGVIAAAVYRFMTAGGIGANIGGGVSVILAAPVVVLLLLWSLVVTLMTMSEDRASRRETHDGADPQSPEFV